MENTDQGQIDSTEKSNPGKTEAREKAPSWHMDTSITEATRPTTEDGSPASPQIPFPSAQSVTPQPAGPRPTPPPTAARNPQPQGNTVSANPPSSASRSSQPGAIPTTPQPGTTRNLPPPTMPVNQPINQPSTAAWNSQPSTTSMNQPPVAPWEMQSPSIPATPPPAVPRTPPPAMPRTPSPVVPRTPAPNAPRRWSAPTEPLPKKDAASVQMLRERCRQVALSLFYRDDLTIRSLGFTSSVAGEGKSFISSMMANLLANDSSSTVTLLEFNWENPSFHEYFGIPARPGLAEWLRSECSESEIRYQVANNLTVIPAGDGGQDAVKLLQLIRQRGLVNIFGHSNELFLVDLPPIVSSAYGFLAASIVEALLVVVRSGVTTDLMLNETFAQMKDLPVHGVIINQMESKVPRWLKWFL